MSKKLRLIKKYKKFLDQFIKYPYSHIVFINQYKNMDSLNFKK